MGNIGFPGWIDRAEPDAVVMVFDRGPRSVEAIHRLTEVAECPKQLRRWFEQAKNEIENGGDGMAWVVILPLDGGSGGFERLRYVGDLEPNKEQMAGAGRLGLELETKGTA